MFYFVNAPGHKIRLKVNINFQVFRCFWVNTLPLA